MPMTPAEVITRWFEELWNQRQESIIDELMHDQADVYGLPGKGNLPIRGRDAFRDFYRAFSGAFPDAHVDLQNTIAEGQRVAAQCRVTGTHRGDQLGVRATGKPVEFWGVVVVDVEDGLITRGWNAFDFSQLYQDIGILGPAVAGSAPARASAAPAAKKRAARPAKPARAQAARRAKKPVARRRAKR